MKRKSLPTGRDFLFVEGYGNENPGAFQSPRPLRGATSVTVSGVLADTTFQPTRPLRGATRTFLRAGKTTCISTHAPLAGRDHGRPLRSYLSAGFQPTRPLRGATLRLHLVMLFLLFQPTRPLRGATAKVYKSLCTFLR